ncbi:MAG: hypothetical protein P8N31_09620 [Planctomycetota bacterium]|nr:hypothetical protein [Planctomycetota bacterium]MDG2143802.1 hypothetical protein [Planctomycetota bacterium]
MKNLNLGSFGALVLAPVLFLGATQEPNAGVDNALRAEVERQAAEIKGMKGELAELASLMAENNKYQAAQSKAAKGLVSVLASAETMGFTAGINPKSRETLLMGFRDYLGTQQKALPGAPRAVEAEGK